VRPLRPRGALGSGTTESSSPAWAGVNSTIQTKPDPQRNQRIARLTGKWNSRLAQYVLEDRPDQLPQGRENSWKYAWRRTCNALRS